MNRRHFLSVSAAAAGAVVVPTHQSILVAAEDANRVGEAAPIPLFDGRTLNGWHNNPQKIVHGTGGRWAVEEGAITGEQDPPGSGNGGLLLTDKTYGDFELSLDIKPDWGIDSGLFVRSTEQGQAFQITVDHLEGGYIGQVYGEGLGGFNTRNHKLAATLDAAGDPTELNPIPVELPEGTSLGFVASGREWREAWKLNDWNRLKVRVAGHLPAITAWINGVKTVELDAEAFRHPKYDREQVRRIVPREGHIALQVHGGKSRWRDGAKCRWRDITLRPL